LYEGGKLGFSMEADQRGLRATGLVVTEAAPRQSFGRYQGELNANRREPQGTPLEAPLFAARGTAQATEQHIMVSCWSCNGA
jgi:hypothetical protein